MEQLTGTLVLNRGALGWTIDSVLFCVVCGAVSAALYFGPDTGPREAMGLAQQRHSGYTAVPTAERAPDKSS